ncbi:MAG TPA: NAD-dependent epimerase/dehydratase family protein [Bacteroidales bacterium]|nr:NAD-dependent epimerase/dehydratase family protein [Bacteroidales bacterium]
MNLLITGVHSIVGAFLVEKLSPYHTVYGMDDTLVAMEGVSQVFTCNEFSQMPEVDAVIHLAGKDADTIDLARSLEYMENNVGLTRCIFEWFKKSNAKQFYYLSSIKVIGNRTNDEDLTEEMIPMPFGPLGESKYMVEQYLQDTWLLDKKVYILRTAFIHGRGLLCNENSIRIFNWVRKGIPYVFGSFECRRSFTSLDNLHFVLVQMLEKDVPGGVYHLTDDGSMTSTDYFKLIGQATGKKVRVWRLGKSFFKVAAVVTGWFHGYFNKFEYLKLSKNFVASNQKLKKALGVKSMPFQLREGLIKSVQEYVENYD